MSLSCPICGTVSGRCCRLIRSFVERGGDPIRVTSPFKRRSCALQRRQSPVSGLCAYSKHYPEAINSSHAQPPNVVTHPQHMLHALGRVRSAVSPRCSSPAGPDPRDARGTNPSPLVACASGPRRVGRDRAASTNVDGMICILERESLGASAGSGRVG